jgi:hypothetical protein
VHGTSEIQLDQIKDSAMKLAAYTHLFNDQAMSDFMQLTQGPEAVDAETGEWDDAATDNDRAALSLERQGSGTAERDVGNKLLEAIDRLYDHL